MISFVAPCNPTIVQESLFVKLLQYIKENYNTDANVFVDISASLIEEDVYVWPPPRRPVPPGFVEREARVPDLGLGGLHLVVVQPQGCLEKQTFCISVVI